MSQPGQVAHLGGEFVLSEFAPRVARMSKAQGPHQSYAQLDERQPVLDLGILSGDEAAEVPG